MAEKIVMDIDELERHMRVTDWLDIANACGAMANQLLVLGVMERSEHYRRLALRAEHRSTELMHGRVLP